MRRDAGSYIAWLLDIVYPERTNRNAPDYSELMDYLMDKEFESVIEMDENRAVDGLDLRKRYMEETNDLIPDFIMMKKCTFLELIIGLAIRIERDIMGEPGNDDESRWFWIMLDNLGLTEFTNNRFRADYVDDILENFMSRNIKKDGKGGLWPLKYPSRDQRDLEIWCQMTDFLNENYSF